MKTSREYVAPFPRHSISLVGSRSIDGYIGHAHKIERWIGLFVWGALIAVLVLM